MTARTRPDARSAPPWTRGVRRVLGVCAIGSVVLAAAFGVFILLVQPNIEHEEEMLATVALFGVSSALALSCLWTLEVSKGHVAWTVFLLAGIALSVFAWGSTCTGLWLREVLGGAYFDVWYESSRRMGQAGIAAYSGAGAVSYAALFTRFRVRRWARVVQGIGCVAAVACALTVTSASLMNDFYDWHARALGSSAMLAALAVIVVPMSAAIFPSVRVARHEAAAGERTAGFTCPACGAAQTIVVGRRVECTGCGLGVEMRIDAPRCACGYDLTDLTTDVCPECGATVPVKHRWALRNARGSGPAPEVAGEQVEVGGVHNAIAGEVAGGPRRDG